MSQKVSVLIIGQNCAPFLRRCLDSLKRFDEVIFIDGGSKDDTIEIAKTYPNVSLYENPWPGFIEQRNFSLSKASHDWCFMIDTDEMVEEDTVEEIYRVINDNPNKVLYKIMRSEFYLGTQLETGYGRSDYQERLFIRDRVKYFGGNHHEHLIDGIPSKEKIELVAEFPKHFRIRHDESYGLHDWISKIPRFVLLVAEEKIQANKKTNAFLVFIAFVGTFFQIWIKNRGLGKVGFIIAIQTAVYRCLVKLKVYEHQQIGFDKKKSIDKYLG